MLRALPPCVERASKTVTRKPRSASSWAALIPATPPPRMATLRFGLLVMIPAGRRTRRDAQDALLSGHREAERGCRPRRIVGRSAASRARTSGAHALALEESRSEERRVGKE